MMKQNTNPVYPETEDISTFYDITSEDKIEILMNSLSNALMKLENIKNQKLTFLVIFFHL